MLLYPITIGGEVKGESVLNEMTELGWEAVLIEKTKLATLSACDTQPTK
jgi:hypothetical protein